MPETPEPPLLNPVLTLQMDPRPEPRPGGGKDASKIVTSRLLQQQEVLASACEQIFRQRAHYPTYAGKVHLIASMYDDSFAPSHTPRDLFNEDLGCRLVAPFTRGLPNRGNHRLLAATGRQHRQTQQHGFSCRYLASGEVECV